MQDFDPIKHVLEHIPAEENELSYFEKQVLFILLNIHVSGKCLNSYILRWNVLWVLCRVTLLLNE